MTLLIGGAPTGLLDSSHSLLGRNDQTSTATTDNGDALFVNVASGNLLYAHQDAYMASRGEDYALLRTYNSRGSSTAGGAFNDARWDVSTTVTLRVIGTGPDTRYEVRYGEGSVFEYALNAATGTYISTDGAGAYETLEVLRDGAGAVLGYTVVRADQARLSFDAQGRLTRWEDPSGVFQSFTYGAFGVTQVTDDEGHTLGYAYNTNGRLISVTDERGVVLVRYAYSGGRLASVTDRRGHVTRYFYYPDGYLQRIELPSTQVVGGVGQSFAARVISFEYQTLTGSGVPPAGTRVLSRMVDAEGKASSFSYAFTLNAQGERTGAGTTTLTDALGKTMRYSYRADGAITSVVDPSGRATTYGYDAAGNLLSVADRNAAGVVLSDLAYYRALRAQLGYTDATGAGKRAADLTAAEKTALKALFTTRYSYDARGNLRTSTDNAGYTTTYTYTAFNKIATITTAEGGVTRFSYDAKQNLIKQVDPGGDVTRFTYDVYGNLRWRVVYLDRADAQKAPGEVAEDKKQVTRFFYDLYGNNTRTIDAEGHSTYATYDRFGNMLTSTDARGNKTRYTYDGDSRLVQLQDAAGRKTLFAYDAVGNRIGLTTDWDGRTITQVFDRNNRLISTIDSAPETTAPRTTTVGYDEVGNRTSVTDAEGRTTTYTYNARRELVEITSAAVDHDGDAATAALQYTRTLAYDFEGNLITETDARGNVTAWQYTRDGLLRLQTMADGQVTQYSYDKNQNLLSVVAGLQLELSKRQSTSYAYDAENQLIRVTDAKDNVTAYDYDAPGNMIEMTDAEGRVSRMSYDRNNRLRFEVSAAVGVFDAVTGAAVIDEGTGLQQTVSYTVEHRFDANGNEIETIDQNGHSTRYTFDVVNRTSSMTDANGITTGYTYDDNDNILAITITAAGAASPSQVSSYRYDEFDQLISATDGVGNALATSDALMYQILRKELGYTVTEGDVTRGKLVAELTDADKTALLAAFTTRYSYDNVGNRKTETDHLGRVTSFDYDTLDRLVRSTDALGGTREYRYDGNSNLLSETDELGRVSSYTYDSRGRIETRSAPLGSGSESTVTQSAYDTFGNVTRLTEAFGTADARTSTYEYDLNNLLTAAVDARGNRTSYAYDAVGNRIRETDARLNSTTFTYDALDRVVKLRDPLTFETRFEYDGVGNRIAMVDARGARTRMEFDPGNRMTTMTDGEGRKTVFGYDALGNTITVTTAAGTTGAGALGAETTTYTYDAENNLRAVEDALGQRTTAGFDRVYNETSVTDARGNTTTTAFDALNRAVLVTDALGGVMRSTYDATGNVLSMQDANGNVTRYAYDRANQVITETDALGVETTYAYDAFGATTTITRAANLAGETRVQRFSYDANGNVTQETDAAGGIKAYVYDANNNLTRATDENGNATTYGYDANNRVITISDPLGGITRYSYDANGNRTVVEDAKGGKTTAYYNADNELALTVDALGYATAYVYDANGNIIQTTRYAAPLSLPANPAVKPTPAVTSAEDRKTTFYFDANNRLTLSVDELGYATGYVYDAAGNVTQQTQYATALSLPLNLAVKPVPATSAEDRSTSAYFDANNRLTLSVDALGYATGYVYDAVGNVTQQTQYATALSLPVNLAVKPTLVTNAKDRSSTLYYDANNRQSLTVDAEGYATTYAYDAVGNVTQRTQYETKLTGYTPGTKPTPATNAKDRTTVMSYDALDRVTTMTDALGFVTRYSYDAVGNRTVVEDAKGNKSTAYFDANNRLTLAVDALGYATGYVYDAVGNVTQQTQYETALTGYTPGTKPVPASNAKDRTTNLSYDRLNRQIKVLDATGQSTRYFYDAFSNLIVVEDPNGVMTFNIYDRGNRLEYSLVAKPRSTITAQFPDGQVWGRGNLELYFIPNFVNGFSANNGIKTSYTYDAANPAWVASTTVKFGNGTGTAAVMQYSHDLLGRITREQGTDGSYRAFRYDELGDVLELDDNGIVTLYTYDLLGRETSRTREQSAGTGTGITETRSYDAVGNVISRTDERGNTTTYAYDAINRLLSASYAAGLGVTTQTYDAVGNLLSVISPEGGTQYFAYDADNRAVRSLSEAGYLTVYQYDAAGNETARYEYDGVYALAADGSVPLPRGDDTARVTQSTWDSMNRLVTRTDSDGLITTYSYDAAGNPTGSTTRTAATTARSEGTLGYDSNDRIIRQVDAAGVVTTYTLNAVGNVLVKVEAAGTATARTTTYAYDQGGTRLRSETTASGRLTRYEYEGGSERLTRKTVEDAADATHTILREERWSYYANGELQLYVNAVGMRTVYNWEGGLEKSITYADGTADAYTVTYSYDARNRLVQEDSGVLFESQMVSTRYEYDDNGNKTATLQAAGIVGQERITRYAYDAQNRLISITDPEGNSTRYGYDAAGDQVWILDANGTVTVTRKNAQGQVSERVVGEASLTAGGDPVLSGGLPVITSANGGVRTTYTYDAANPALVASETTEFADGTGDAHTTRYTYDVLGRQKTITDAEGFSSSFDYDEFGNLSRVTVGSYLLIAGQAGFDQSKADRAIPQTTTFTYDAANNLIYTVDAEGGAIRSTYDVLGNRETQITGIADSNAANYPELRLSTTYLWYADGTLKEQSNDAGERTVIVRDVLGRQTSVRTLQSVSGAVEVWTQTGYVYDKAGRVIRENPADNPFGMLFYYDAAGNLIREVVSTTDLDRTRSYRYDLMGRLVWSSGSVGNRAVYGSLYSFSGSPTTYTYDAVGNLIKTEDAKGGVMRFYYNEYNQLIAKVDAEGGYTTYVRDAFGNELETYARPNKVTGTLLDLVPPSTINRGPTERVSFRTYDGNNRVLTETSNQVINYGNGTTRAWLYDSTGLLLRLTETPAGSSTSLINTVTASGAGRVQSWSYDRTGRIRSFTAADGVVESYRYDAAGNKIEERVHNPALLTNGLAAPLNSDPDRLTTYTYLSNGWLRTQTTGRNVQTLGYDRAGNVISKTDARNNTSTTRYDLMNRAISTVDASGKETRYAYDVFGNLTRVIDVRVSEGSSPVTTEAVKEFWYDLDGRVVLEVRPAFETWSLPLTSASPNALEKGLVFKTYDAVGNLIRITDERGFVTRNWYDLLGRKVAERNGDGALRTFGYNVFGDVTSTTLDRTARSALDVSDAAPVPVVAAADAITMRYEYDAKGRLTTTTWPQVTVTTLTDTDTATAVGAPTVSQSSSNLSTRTTYDAWGNVVSVRDANGATTYSYYDINGRVVAQVDATGYLTSFAYDCQGHLVRELKYKTTLAAGSFSTALKPTALASDIGSEINRVYDAENNLVQETGPSVLTERGLRRMTTYFSYDAAGNLIAKRVGDIDTTTQDKEQIQEYYFYDALNRPVASVATNRVLTTFTYDRNGNLKEQRRYFNPLTAAQLATRTDPALAATAATVLPVASAAADQVKTFFYNEVNLLVRETELAASAGGIDITRVYGYDRSGHRSYVREGDLAADGTLLPAGTALIVANPVLRESFYTYDAAGRQTVASEAKHDNQKHFTTYNTAGQIVKAWYTPTHQGSPAQTKVEEYRYNDAGFLVATNAGNGLWRAFDVDAMGRALRTRLYGSLNAFNNQGLAANAPLLSYDFFDKTGSVTKHIDEIGARYASERDYAGRLVTKIEPGRLQTDKSITRYAYDSAGNLVTETDAESRTTQYRYDRLGNMTRKTWPAGNAQVWVYDISGTAFYDNALSGTYFIEANGTEVIGTRESYTLDSFGRRTRSDVGGVVTVYTYDRHDRLQSKTTAAATTSSLDDATARYLYDTFDNQVGVQDENGNFFLRTFNAAGLQYEYSFRGVIANPSRGVTSETFVQAKPTTLAAALAAVRSGHPNLVAALWVTDYLGFIVRRPSNLSSSQSLNLVFDDFGRVLEEILAGGRDVTYSYDRFGRRVTRSTAFPGLDQAYGYDAAGRLTWTLDIPQSTVDQYTLDYAGNVIAENMVSNATSSILASGQVLYGPKSGGYGSLTRTTSEYNKNNELVRWDELDSAGTSIYWERFGYDGNGRHITWYTQTNPTNYTNTASFDGANRLLRSIDGAVFTYGANGNRASMSSSATGLLVYGYYADGKLKDTRRDSAAGVELEYWAYDKAGNVARYIEGNTQTFTVYDSSNAKMYSQVLDASANERTETRFFFWETGAIKEIGVVVSTLSAGLVPAGTVTANLNYKYDQGSLLLSIFMTGASTGNGTSEVYLTTDGRTRKVIDATEPTREFLYDARGNIVQKREYVISIVGVTESQTLFLCAAGKPVAERYRSGSNYTGGVISNWSAWADSGSEERMAYEPIDASYPQSSEIQHTVIAGETLRSLATQYYGTPDLWYVIAEENGLTGSEMLSVGARMVVPGTTDNNYRTAENYSVYKPGDIVGSVLPGIPPAAQTASDDGCLLQAAIITLIVVIAIAAIAATIITAGALAPVFAAGAAAAAGTGGGVVAGVVVASTAAGVAAIAVGVAASVVAGVVIAAAASALIQAALIGFGVQKEFDTDQFKQDVVAGAIGGLAAGAGSAVAAVKAVTTVGKVAIVLGQVALEVAGEVASQAVVAGGTLKADNAWMIGVAAAGGALGGVSDVIAISRKSTKAASAAAEFAAKKFNPEQFLKTLRAENELKNLNVAAEKGSVVARLQADVLGAIRKTDVVGARNVYLYDDPTARVIAGSAKALENEEFRQFGFTVTSGLRPGGARELNALQTLKASNAERIAPLRQELADVAAAQRSAAGSSPVEYDLTGFLTKKGWRIKKIEPLEEGAASKFQITQGQRLGGAKFDTQEDAIRTTFGDKDWQKIVKAQSGTGATEALAKRAKDLETRLAVAEAKAAVSEAQAARAAKKAAARRDDQIFVSEADGRFGSYYKVDSYKASTASRVASSGFDAGARVLGEIAGNLSFSAVGKVVLGKAFNGLRALHPANLFADASVKVVRAAHLEAPDAMGNMVIKRGAMAARIQELNQAALDIRINKELGKQEIWEGGFDVNSFGRNYDRVGGLSGFAKAAASTKSATALAAVAGALDYQRASTSLEDENGNDVNRSLFANGLLSAGRRVAGDKSRYLAALSPVLGVLPTVSFTGSGTAATALFGTRGDGRKVATNSAAFLSRMSGLRQSPPSVSGFVLREHFIAVNDRQHSYQPLRWSDVAVSTTSQVFGSGALRPAPSVRDILAMNYLSAGLTAGFDQSVVVANAERTVGGVGG